jgi:hypothetical protein
MEKEELIGKNEEWNGKDVIWRKEEWNVKEEELKIKNKIEKRRHGKKRN